MLSPEDTIAAIATPIQPSGIGVIRVSGIDAISILQPIFKGSEEAFKKSESHKLQYGWIHDGGDLVDQVLIAVMHAPNSYTTEDVVEVQCHGSPIVLKKILDLITKNGARIAEAGEFTQRAFLNDRIDLTQAEAVSDLVHSNSEIGAKLAVHQLHGKLFKYIEEVKKKVVTIASLIEASIEFPEEGLEINTREDCMHRIDNVCSDLKEMLSLADQGRRIKMGFLVAIIGRPNVGKSSLFNTMLQEQRVIVTSIPGTTRDSVEESIQIQGLSFRLTDTAGIRQTKELIEKEGITRTQLIIGKADIVLIILDASAKLTGSDQTLIDSFDKEKTLLVINKKDLLTDEFPDWYKSISSMKSVLVSAKNGDGCEELESCLFNMVTQGRGLPKYEDFYITNRRQQHAAEKALSALEKAKKILLYPNGEEFLAVDLRSCINALGEIVGETSSDDLLGKIFSEFCIGK